MQVHISNIRSGGVELSKRVQNLTGNDTKSHANSLQLMQIESCIFTVCQNVRSVLLQFDGEH